MLLAENASVKLCAADKRLLNLYLGTLADGLGCFPFDCETYLTQSDSHY